MTVSTNAHLVVAPSTTGTLYSIFSCFINQCVIGISANGLPSPIHTLDDYTLLNIFYLYRLDCFCDNVPPSEWNSERWWYKLTQVCRSWRHLILASPSTLCLRLVCTYGTPVTKMLEHSPHLPLIINYMDEHLMATAEDEEGILLALQHRDRVRRVGLDLLAPISQKVIEAMDGEFPILKSLFIGSWINGDKSLVLPKTFQAPNLRELVLFSAALPKGSPLLTNAVGLVNLMLVNIPSSAYFSPSYLLTRLPLMPQLETLVISFHTPLPNRDVTKKPLDCPIMAHITLPNLRFFEFRGVSAYLETLLGHISAPHLKKLRITFFNQLTLAIPRLLQFMDTSENIEFSNVLLNFDRLYISVETEVHRDKNLRPLYIEISCKYLDWQVACAVQVLNALWQKVTDIEQLTLHYVEHDLSSEQHTEVDRTQWRELLRPFSKVKTLNVQSGLVGKLFRSLQADDGAAPLNLLPNLKELNHFGGGDVGDAFVPFIDERQAAGYPVNLTTV
jgi:hypothetical protein